MAFNYNFLHPLFYSCALTVLQLQTVPAEGSNASWRNCWGNFWKL